MFNPVVSIFSSWDGTDLPPIYSDAHEVLGRSQCISLVHARAATLDIGAGEAVLVASGRGVRFFIDMLAVWLSGGIAVPYDSASSADIRRHMLETANARKVLEDTYSLVEFNGEQFPSRPLSDGDTCAFLFTSGSTGKPKAVELSARALFGNACSTLAVLKMDRERLFINIPFHFTSAICHFLACAYSSSTLLGYEGKLIFGDFVSALSTLKPTAVGGAPVQFRWLADALSGHSYEFVQQLRFIMSSGDHFPENIIAALRRHAPELGIFTVYGLTEVGGRFCLLPPEWQAIFPGSVGRPIDGLVLKILEQDGEKDLGVHAIGEVVIEGAFLAKGYFGNQEATARTFTAYGFRTGDLGFLNEEGFLFLKGRSDDVFKVNGAKVSGVLIAQALMQIGYFSDAAVVGVSIPPFGTVPVAGVVLKAGCKLEKGAVRKALRQLLPGNHIPHDIIALNYIPRTGSGKVQKGQLKKLLDM